MVGRPRPRKKILRSLQASFNEAVRGVYELLEDPRAGQYETQPLFSFMVERSLLDTAERARA